MPILDIPPFGQATRIGIIQIPVLRTAFASSKRTINVFAEVRVAERRWKVNRKGVNHSGREKQIVGSSRTVDRMCGRWHNSWWGARPRVETDKQQEEGPVG